jgi:Family of unknown function (DUF5946)
VHRYMTASPGCWRIYGELTAEGLPATPMAALAVDAYAVTHPGSPGPQSTPSVWIHLVTLCAVLERGWAVDQAIRLRRATAVAFSAWSWLTPPDSMGDVTAVDVAAAAARDDGSAPMSVDRWVTEAWHAWDVHAPVVRDRVDDVTRRFFD